MCSLKLQLHSEAMLSDSLLYLVPCPLCISPIIVRLHHDLIKAKILASFHSWSHCIRHPVEALVQGVAIVCHRLDGDVMLLVLITEAARHRKFLRKHIETEKLDILILRLCKLCSYRIHKPLICLDSVFRLCKIHCNTVDFTPIYSISILTLHCL